MTSLHQAGMPPEPIPAIRPAVFRDLRGIVAAFSTRTGGVSPAPWFSLNLGESVGDDPHRVHRNRNLFFRSLGLDPARVAFARQVHGATARLVHQPGLYPDCDGLVTNTPNLALALKGADCAIILLADPEAGVIGGAHAGWRGFLAGVVGATIEQMCALGARPDTMRAYASPCISVDRFEVGEEVARRFPASLVHRRPDRLNPDLDLKQGLADLLRERGLLEAHIEVDPRCTASNAEQFFSHRTSNGLTGRHLGIISLSSVG